MLIDAAPSILNKVDCVFLAGGKGPALEEYKKKVKEKSIDKKFIFTGFVEDDILHEFYGAGDVFAFPSYFDTQGLSMIEAMACGVPCVAAKDSAAGEFIKEGISGFLFSSPMDFPEKIIQGIEKSKEMRKSTSEEGKKYSIKEATERLLALYETLIP